MASDEFQWCGWRIPQVPRILKLFQSDTILRMRSKPETINNDPHGEGWLIKIKLANPAEVNALMEAAAYEAFYRGKDKRSIRLIYRPNEATESVVILSAL